MRTIVQRDHANLVNHLLENRHITRRLHDLKVVVIPARELGRAARNAALA